MFSIEWTARNPLKYQGICICTCVCVYIYIDYSIIPTNFDKKWSLKKKNNNDNNGNQMRSSKN